MSFSNLSVDSRMLWNAGQRDNRYSKSSSSSRQCRHTASTVPLLKVWRFFWRMYVPVRILPLTIAFLTSVTEDSTIFYTMCEVPTRKLCTDKYFRVFFVFISHTSCLFQNEFMTRIHICFHWSLVKLLHISWPRDGRSYFWRIFDRS